MTPEKKGFTLPKKLLIFMITALIIEVFIFNFRFWTTLGNEPFPIELPYEEISGESYGLFTLNLSRRDISVKNLGFCLDPYETDIPIESTRAALYKAKLPAKIRVEYKDENGTSHSVEKEFSVEKGRLLAMTINAGNTDSIVFSYDNAYLKQLSLNVRYDFSFSLYRIIILFLLPCFICAFRSASKLWKIKIFDQELHISRKLLAVHLGLCALIFLSVSVLFFSNPFFSDIPDIFGFYPELARSFANGQTYDAELPPQELLSLPDPYDPQVLSDPNVNYKLDRLLYNGRYYTYFGPLPCVLFYLPFYLITGSDMPHSVILLILLALFLTVTSLVLTEACKRYHRECSIAAFYTGFFTVITVTPLTIIASGDTFPYYIPILLAVCLLLAGMYFYLKAAALCDNARRGNAYFALGSASIALIAACRPNLLLFVVVFVPLLLKYALFKKSFLKRWLSFIAPVIVIAIPVLAYNYVRFGNPFDYGYAYQLTINGMQKHPSVDSILAALWHFFLRPIHFTADFPYVRFLETEWSNPEGTLVQPVSGGIMLLYPVLFFGVLCFFLKRTKEKNSLSTEMHLTSMAAILLSLVSCVISSINGGFTTRYLMDFSTMLSLSAVFMIWKHTDNENRTAFVLRNLICIFLLIGSFHSFTQLFRSDLVDHDMLTDVKCRFEQAFEFWR